MGGEDVGWGDGGGGDVYAEGTNECKSLKLSRVARRLNIVLMYVFLFLSCA